MKQFALWTSAAVVAAGFLGRAEAAPVVAEPAETFPWTVSAGPGLVVFDGDQWTKDGFYLQGRLSYEVNQRLNFDGFLFIAPSLDANKPDNREKQPDFSSTWMGGAGVEAIFHLTRWERFDPYIAAGLHGSVFGDDQKNGHNTDIALRGGGGALYHFDEEWALRFDARMALGGIDQDSEANGFFEAGLCWTWGAKIPAKYMVAGGDTDSDADGLTDAEEKGIYKTNPYDPDTDHDGLTDYEEVKATYGYKTDPLNPDTDYDLLKDGAEVLVIKTNPLDPDTDKGGVSDGHEVIEDGTDPLFKDDDLILFSLNLEFDYDKSIIKSVYFDDLAIIGGKTMTREYPGSTAKLEGHADRQKLSLADYNQKLSERRAIAVMDYLATHFAISTNRLSAVGYGFSRPKYPNTDRGNPKNRRVDVYIRRVDQPVSTRVQPKFDAKEMMVAPLEEDKGN
jgi:outer membrane protein OmpA-like peptidoglycan-associated protein/outer membrane protein W